jgi:membrane fusion protein, copper/silver efflux system
MYQRMNIISAVFTLILFLAVSSCSRERAHADLEYTCPMHPTVISDRPGSCPVCGMDLVLKDTAPGQQSIDQNVMDVLQSTNESIVANVRTIKGQYKAIPISYEAQGIVTYDSRNIYTISSRITGRVEKLFLKFPYQSVKKGQKVAEIYSPELITAQRELLFLLENDAENVALIQSARTRLSVLGLTQSQINSLERTKVVGNTFPVFSPYSGYVISTQDVPVSVADPQQTGNGMAEGMSQSSLADSPAPAESSPSIDALLKEGNYISKGQTLFRIVNNESLRIELDLPAGVSSSVRKGDQLKMDFGMGHQQTATVDFIEPFFDKDREFVKVRVNTSNIQNLHIGHLLHAKIKSDSIEGLWLPREAVLDIGKEKIVFIRERASFKPHAVGTGVSATGDVQIVRGLTSGDEVAANAQYLVDSESIIKTHE